MSGEERQRILRRAGHNDPAEAERQEKAHASREQASAEDAGRQAEDDAAVEPTPVAESDDGPPRPRR
jgi:hypothetical protein